MSKKRSWSALTFLLSLMVAVSVAVCHCVPDFSSEHDQHAQAVQEEHCHEETLHHQDSEDSKHANSGHACLCSNDSTDGYLVLTEKAPVKTDFLFAVLNQFQHGFVINRPFFKSLRLTHSPPRESQRLYITHLTLLI